MKRTRQLRFCQVGMLLSLLAVFIGCGGGSGTGGGNPSGAGTPGGGTPGGGSTGGTISAQQRSATFKAVEDKIASLPSGTTYEQFNTIMTQFLSSRPEFSSVSVTDGVNIGATFTDGKIYMIYNDIRPTQTRSVPLAKSARTRDAALGLPKTSQARILTALGTWTENPSQGGPDAAPDVRSYLSDAGYTLLGGEATLDVLKNIHEDGLFYIHTHGGTIGLDKKFGGGSSYALWTASEREEAKEDPNSGQYDRELNDDLLARRIGWCTEAHYNQIWVVPLGATHYCITPAFIRKYKWQFATNSLVFINACLSASAGANDLHAALKESNAYMTTGWTNLTDNGVANNAARYIIDRLTGGNTYQPESPNQRAFDFQSTYDDMHSKSLDHSHTVFEGKTYDSDFKFLPQNTTDADDHGFALLTPSIQGLFVNEADDELTVNGIFGKDLGQGRGKVTVGGKELAVKEWKPDHIRLDLPRTGAGAAGNVVVSVDDRKSNTVPLTAWRTTLTYTFTGEGSLKYSLKMDLHFRADVHTPRYKAGETPGAGGDQVTGFYEAQDSTGSYSAGGQASQPCQNSGSLVRKWSGTGTLSPLISNPPAATILAGRIFHITGFLNLKTRKLELHFDNPSISEGVQQDSTECDSSSNPPYTGKITMDKKVFQKDSHGADFTLNLQLDDKFNIPAYSKSDVTDSTDEFGDQQPNPISVTLAAASAISPPDTARGEDQSKSRAAQR